MCEKSMCIMYLSMYKIVVCTYSELDHTCMVGEMVTTCRGVKYSHSEGCDLQ